MLKHSQISTTNGVVHLAESGGIGTPAILFLHGWPQSWVAFEAVMELASATMHAYAIDLPGIGESVFESAPATKRDIALCIYEVIASLGLNQLTLVGHDIGGQVAFAFLTELPTDLRRVVIMDVVIPGLKPWDDVIRNPNIWHFAFHDIPALPEELVEGKQREYFDYFYNAIAAHSEKISDDARAAHVRAYAAPAALTAGFNWYRAFPSDAETNRKLVADTRQIDTPVLYIRGDKEGGSIDDYVDGLRTAGLQSIRSVAVSDCGHFAPEEQPEAVWSQIEAFVESS